jgi:hypothetical protein
MHFLSPADAFLVVATLGTAILIEIGIFIVVGMIWKPRGLANTHAYAAVKRQRRRAPWQWGRKPARWPPFTGGFSHEYLNVAGTPDMTDFP